MWLRQTVWESTTASPAWASVRSHTTRSHSTTRWWCFCCCCCCSPWNAGSADAGTTASLWRTGKTSHCRQRRCGRLRQCGAVQKLIEQKAEPFLRRTRYSLSVLKGHLRSMIFMSYERPHLSLLMRYDQFSVEKRTCFLPPTVQRQLHCIYQILSAKSLGTANYSRKTFFF